MKPHLLVLSAVVTSDTPESCCTISQGRRVRTQLPQTRYAVRARNKPLPFETTDCGPVCYFNGATPVLTDADLRLKSFSSCWEPACCLKGGNEKIARGREVRATANYLPCLSHFCACVGVLPLQREFPFSASVNSIKIPCKQHHLCDSSSRQPRREQ